MSETGSPSRSIVITPSTSSAQDQPIPEYVPPPPLNPVKDGFPRKMVTVKRREGSKLPTQICVRDWSEERTAYLGTTNTSFPTPGYTGVNNINSTEFDFFDELFHEVGRYVVVMTNRSVRRRHHMRRYDMVESQAETLRNQKKADELAHVAFTRVFTRKVPQPPPQPVILNVQQAKPVHHRQLIVSKYQAIGAQKPMPCILGNATIIQSTVLKPVASTSKIRSPAHNSATLQLSPPLSPLPQIPIPMMRSITSPMQCVLRSKKVTTKPISTPRLKQATLDKNASKNNLLIGQFIQQPINPQLQQVIPAVPQARKRLIITITSTEQKACQDAIACFSKKGVNTPVSNIELKKTDSLEIRKTTDVIELPTAEELPVGVRLLGDGEPPKKRSRRTTHRSKKPVSSWEPLTINEFYAFMGVLIIMGFNRQPEISSYWCKGSDLGTLAVRQALSRKRFMQIWNELHYSAQPSFYKGKTRKKGAGFAFDKVEAERLVDQKDKESVDDPALKARTFLEMVNKAFRKCRNPGQILCVDEAMAPYTGRKKVKICQPRKPHRYGLEMMEVVEATTGYILNDEPHVGKEVKLVFDKDEDPKPFFPGNWSGHVAFYIARFYLKLGHIIVADNRFCTPELFEYLYTHQDTYAVGPVRPNTAQMPTDHSTLRQFTGNKKGDSIVRQNGRLTCTAWKDTATVVLISTIADPLAIPGKVKRYCGGVRKEIECPASIMEYHKGSNWADVANHLAFTYRIGRRCRCWHRCLFFHKINQICVNARINMKDVYGIPPKKERSQLRFRRALAQQLIAKNGAASNEKPNGSHTVDEITNNKNKQHRMVKAKNGKSARCKVCHVHRDERHESVWVCAPCQVHVCSQSRRDCFKLHKQGKDKRY